MSPYDPPNDTDLAMRIDRVERELAFARRSVWYRWFFGVLLMMFLLWTDWGNKALQLFLFFIRDVSW